MNIITEHFRFHQIACFAAYAAACLTTVVLCAVAGAPYLNIIIVGSIISVITICFLLTPDIDAPFAATITTLFIGVQAFFGWYLAPATANPAIHPSLIAGVFFLGFIPIAIRSQD